MSYLGYRRKTVLRIDFNKHLYASSSAKCTRLPTESTCSYNTQLLFCTFQKCNPTFEVLAALNHTFCVLLSGRSAQKGRSCFPTMK